MFTLMLSFSSVYFHPHNYLSPNIPRLIFLFVDVNVLEYNTIIHLTMRLLMGGCFVKIYLRLSISLV